MSVIRIRLSLLGIAVFFAAAGFQSIGAAEPALDKAEPEPVAAEFTELGTEYEKLNRELIRALPPDGGHESDSQITDEEWLRQGREMEAAHPDPDDKLLPRFLALAKAHPESTAALDALAFVMYRGGSQTGDVQGAPWRLKEEAIDLVAEHHMADPRVVHIFKLLGGTLPSQKSEAFLRQAFATAPNRAARAAAGFNLAQYFCTLAHVHARSKQIKTQSRLANNERFWKLVVTPYLQTQFPYDEAKVSAEVDHLLAQVIDDYGNVPATDWKSSGPGRVFLTPDADAPRKTYGGLAKSLRFAQNHLLPGKQAPEIEGVDAEGNRFRLSDYRGKVVLLTFSANWCGGCVELYPLQRNLVEKFRDKPFALLSVSGDESIDTLKSSTTSGAITWRCWWDGLHGPICEAWNSPGASTLYLLDQQGMIADVHLNRFTPAEEFDRAITSLLSKPRRD